MNYTQSVYLLLFVWLFSSLFCFYLFVFVLFLIKLREKIKVKKYLYCKITPGVVHLWYGMPRIGLGIKLFSCIHTRDAVKPTQRVDTSVVRDATDATSAVAHGCDHCPLVD